jgi:hydroxysqualene dehydroxylase
MRFADLPGDESFEVWLRRHGQTQNAIQRLWNLIIIPTCNAPADRISAAMGGFVFSQGLLRTRWGGRLGYPRVGLSDIVPGPAVSYLEQHGAAVRFGAAIVSLNSGAAVTSTGERVQTDAYVAAVPAGELGALVPEPWAQIDLEEAPIVGINLWYDRPLFDGEVLAAIVDGEVFWLFDRTRILGKPGPEHHIAASISAAEASMDVPRHELADGVAARLAKVLPGPVLNRRHVEKVRAATFVPAPGARRPPTRTPIPNLFLAGSWTDTGWPDTMESAVRSGHQAARSAQDFVQEAFH